VVEAAPEAGDARVLPAAEEPVDRHQLPDVRTPEPGLDVSKRRRRDVVAVLLEAGEHQNHSSDVAHVTGVLGA
jgi:hypothetical protein